MSSAAPSTVTGNPCSLLKLRALAATRRVAPIAAAARSLVLVLPTLPVMPTTGAPRRRTAQAASVINASPVSSTAIAGIVTAGSGGPCRQVGAGPGVGRRRDEVVTVTVGDDRHEQLTRRHEP